MKLTKIWTVISNLSTFNSLHALKWSLSRTDTVFMGGLFVQVDLNWFLLFPAPPIIVVAMMGNQAIVGN